LIAGHAGAGNQQEPQQPDKETFHIDSSLRFNVPALKILYLAGRVMQRHSPSA
jgi:hypothetical protein